jgi:hypothetical protein
MAETDTERRAEPSVETLTGEELAGVASPGAGEAAHENGDKMSA